MEDTDLKKNLFGCYVTREWKFVVLLCCCPALACWACQVVRCMLCVCVGAGAHSSGTELDPRAGTTRLPFSVPTSGTAQIWGAFLCLLPSFSPLLALKFIYFVAVCISVSLLVCRTCARHAKWVFFFDGTLHSLPSLLFSVSDAHASTKIFVKWC